MRYTSVILSLALLSCSSNEKEKETKAEPVFNEEAEFSKGTRYLQEMKADSAIWVFENIVQKGKETERAWCGLGISYLLKREPQKALDAFKNALEADPNSYDALNGIGSAYLDMQEYEKALEYYRLAQNADPAMAEGNRNLVIVFDKLNQPDSALVYAKKYLEAPGSENDYDIQQIVKKYSKQ